MAHPQTLQPLDPWHVLQINVLELYGLVAFGLPTRARQRESDRLDMAVEAPIFFCGPTLCLLC